MNDSNFCTGCRLEKPFIDFNKSSRNKSGRAARCKACMAEKNRARYAANREKLTTQIKAWREANPEKTKAARKAYRKANPEKMLAEQRAWRKAHPEKMRERWHNRRARELLAEGSFTAAEWRAKLELYKGRCHWCHKSIKGHTHADHVVALAKGGTNYISNIVPSCAKCNLTKKDKSPVEFMGRLF